MLDALKALDARTHEEPVEVPATPETLAATNWEIILDEASSLVDEAAETFGLPPLHTPDPLAESPPVVASPPKRVAAVAAPFESCTLPIVAQPAEHYLEMAARICDQGSANYSNVMLFVTADRGAQASFSMTELAQSFALRLAGDVLLIDGDLRDGQLSKAVSRPGPGMVEAMLGQAQWPDLIHPTNVARIDFVARGNGHVPTFERPHFGWSSLRPLYRAVVIGPANQAEPETLWLAARCDAVYFVVSRLHTRRSNATAAVNALRAGGANVAGCIVVND